MNKLLLLVTILIASSAAYALDLTMANGKIYKNVEIMNKTPDGFDIESHQDGDMTVLRHVRYTELSPESLKEFPAYDPVKSKEYLDALSASYAKAKAANAEKHAAWEKRESTSELVSYPDSDMRMHIVFKSVRVVKNGTIGWASAEDASVTTGQYGKIYIYGLRITEDNEWVGDVYPTKLFITDHNSYVPGFALTEDIANALDARGN